MKAAELNVRADGNGLIGNYSDGSGDVAAAGRIAQSRLIIDDQGVCGRDRDGAAARLTRIGSAWSCSRHGHACQIRPILVEQVDGDVGRRRASVKDKQIGIGTATGVIIRRRADPDIGWAATGGSARGALRARRPLRAYTCSQNKGEKNYACDASTAYKADAHTKSPSEAKAATAKTVVLMRAKSIDLRSGCQGLSSPAHSKERVAKRSLVYIASAR